MDRLVDDIWCDKIKHEDFEDVIKHMTAGTNGLDDPRYVPGTNFPIINNKRLDLVIFYLID